MSNIKILIVEDDPLYALDLKILVDELGYECVGVVDNSDQIFEVVKKQKTDLILMDIKIKGDLNGIDVAHQLKKLVDIAIIFITSYDNRKLYEKAKNTSHFGYLVKPISNVTLESAIEVALLAMGAKDENEETTIEGSSDLKDWSGKMILDNYVFIKRNNKLEKVGINEIQFIQSEGNYCVISTEKKKFALKMSLIKVKKMLDTHPFARVNKRHIINMNLISTIDLSSNQININDISFAIGRSYKEDLLKRLKTLS